MATDTDTTVTIIMENSMENKANDRNPEQSNAVDYLVIIEVMLKMLRRSWWFLLAIVSIFSTAFYFYFRWTFKPLYSSYSTFSVRTVNVANSSITASTADQQVTKVLGEVFPYLLTNTTMLHLVEEDLGKNYVPGSISASALEDTNLITLTVTSSDPRDAYAVLQSVIRNYPKVSDYVIGDLVLKPIDESGRTLDPVNSVNYRSRALLGGVVGAALFFAIIFIYAYFRKTAHSEEDLENIFSIKSLGAVPETYMKKRSNMDADRAIIIDRKGVSSSYVEAVRSVRNRIQREADKIHAKTILITSAIPSEGKSTVAVNLALSLAAKNKKVVLMDCDLRNPSCARTLGMPKPRYGVADLLNGKASIEDVIVFYKDQSNLALVPGREAMKDPGDSLSSPVLKKVIEGLKLSSDYVIIDTPPSSVFSDAAMVAKSVDAGVFLVRQDYARVESLRDGMEMFLGSGVKMLGSVLNYSNAGISHKGGHFGYVRYGYNNGYYGKYGKYGRYYNRNGYYGSAPVRGEDDKDE